MYCDLAMGTHKSIPAHTGLRLCREVTPSLVQMWTSAILRLRPHVEEGNTIHIINLDPL